MRFWRRGTLFSGAALCAITVSAPIQAQPQAATNAPAADSADDAIIVTGTRDQGQVARKSLSPIVVVSAAQLAQTGQANLREALEKLSPSISLPGFTSDLAGLVDTFKLRGLGADQTLVLVNGKRRHSTATINNNAAPDEGATGADIDMIPVSAIDHVEILQDGASALYGSDAIGGVVNIILRSSPGGSFSTENGASYKGDGFSSTTSAEYGFSLAGRGFVNLSAEYTHLDHTDRGGTDIRTGAHTNLIFGRPRSDRETFGLNAGYDLSGGTTAYVFGTYGHRTAASLQNYRLPSILPDLYPNGYSPLEHVNESDFSVTGGLKGTIGGGWNWDLSSTYGEDRTSLGLSNSSNRSLYADTGSTPTSFHLGRYANTQWTNTLDIHRAFDIPFLASPVNLSFGGEQRRETYDIGAGDAASFYGGGSDAYGGEAPFNAVHAHRNVLAAYINADAELVRGLKIDLAGRFEHYNDAGDTRTGKVSARYQFTKWAAVRGTASSGFRAPTLAEEHYTNVAVGPDTAAGQLAVDSASAHALGATALKPERSRNYSAGIVLNPVSNLDLTVDAYQITIRNRIVEGGVYSGAPAIAALEAQGISLPTDLNPNSVSVQYFSNGADTRTRGIDAAARYRMRLGDRATLNLDLAYNYNRTRVLSVKDDQNGNALLSLQGVAYLSTYTPRTKTIVGGDFSLDRFHASLHEIRYGHTVSELTYYEGADAFSTSAFRRLYNGAKYETDVALSYDLTPRVSFTLGANNLLDARPRRIPVENSYTGVQRYDGGIGGIGIYGGYYYFRLGVKL